MPQQLGGFPWRLPVVTVCTDTDGPLGGGAEEGLTQAKAELSGGEETCVGLVQTFEHSLQLFRGEGQVTLQALARPRDRAQ